MAEGDVEGMDHSEVEEVYQLMVVVVEQIISTKPRIIPDMDKTLAIINQIMETSSNNVLNNINLLNNIRPRSSINLPSNINLHLDPMSILHSVTCKLRSIHNLSCPNMGSSMDKTINHHMQTKVMPTHHPENVHETKLSETQTEDIP